MYALIVLVVGVAAYWFFVLRPGRLTFWRVAGKHPDAAYDHFKSDPCWRVFEERLPHDYRGLVPRSEWTGPFRLVVPRLGDRMIYVFGKYPTFEKSQNDFLSKYGRSI